jgi:hypothetical protein
LAKSLYPIQKSYNCIGQSLTVSLRVKNAKTPMKNTKIVQLPRAPAARRQFIFNRGNMSHVELHVAAHRVVTPLLA